MSKFICTHTFPAGAFTAAQLQQLGDAAQQDAVIKGYRSFANLAEGKAVCIMEAPNRQALTDWFAKVGMPVDGITPLEYEGECGNIHAA
jgi:hypothetical protein